MGFSYVAAVTGGELMAAYRVYRLDGAGKVLSAEWIEADNDEQAVETARGLESAVRFEVWQGQRLISRAKPDPR